MYQSPNKILLISPRFTQQYFWGFPFVAEMFGFKSITQPLGLITVAALLDGYETRLLDMNVSGLTDKDIDWADIIFLTGMSVVSKSMDEVLEKLKGKTVVVGGPRATGLYSEIKGASCFVLGEFEAVASKFLSDMAQGQLKKAYAHASSRRETEELKAYFGDDIYICPEGTLPCLQDTAIPRFDLLDIKAYGMMSVQTTRGCPSCCEFCNIWRQYGRKQRHKPVENVIKELDELYRLGWRSYVFIADDNPMGDKIYAKELFRAIAKWQIARKYPFEFFSEGSIDLADDTELLEFLAVANYTSIFLGLETPLQENLKSINKNINLSGDIVSRVHRLQAHGLFVKAGFIIGFDGDSEDIGQRMADFLQELGISVAMMSILVAIPHSNLFERMKKEGRLIYNKCDTGKCFQPNFETLLPVKTVMNSFRTALALLYPKDMKRYFDRVEARVKRSMTQRRTLDKIIQDRLPGVDHKGFIKPGQMDFPSELINRINRVKVIFFLLRNGYFSFLVTALPNMLRLTIKYPDHKPLINQNSLYGYFLRISAHAYIRAASLWDIMKEQVEYIYNTYGLRNPQDLIIFFDAPLPENPKENVPMSPVNAKTKAIQSALSTAKKAFSRFNRMEKNMISEEYTRFVSALRKEADEP